MEAPEVVPVLVHGGHGAKVSVHPALHRHLIPEALKGASCREARVQDEQPAGSCFVGPSEALTPSCECTSPWYDGLCLFGCMETHAITCAVQRSADPGIQGDTTSIHQRAGSSQHTMQTACRREGQRHGKELPTLPAHPGFCQIGVRSRVCHSNCQILQHRPAAAQHHRRRLLAARLLPAAAPAPCNAITEPCPARDVRWLLHQAWQLASARKCRMTTMT